MGKWVIVRKMWFESGLQLEHVWSYNFTFGQNENVYLCISTYPMNGLVFRHELSLQQTSSLPHAQIKNRNHSLQLRLQQTWKDYTVYTSSSSGLQKSMALQSFNNHEKMLRYRQYREPIVLSIHFGGQTFPCHLMEMETINRNYKCWHGTKFSPWFHSAHARGLVFEYKNVYLTSDKANHDKQKASKAKMFQLQHNEWA